MALSKLQNPDELNEVVHGRGAEDGEGNEDDGDEDGEEEESPTRVLMRIMKSDPSA